MLSAVLTVALACTGQQVSPAPSPAASPSPLASAGRVFAVIVRTGPGWDAAKPANAQPHFAEHSANIRRLAAAGSLSLGGRMGDMGLLLVRAGSEAEARALFDADPSIAGGTFRLEIHEWRTFAPGCVEAPAPVPRASPR